jgi:hypothetical protein
MDAEQGKARRQYERPAVVRLTAPKAAGDCFGGSGDENCTPTGNSAMSCCVTGNADLNICATGNGVVV